MKLQYIRTVSYVVYVECLYSHAIGVEENLVHIELVEAAILIKAKKKNVRKGWGKAFKKMRALREDKLVINDFFEDEI